MISVKIEGLDKIIADFQHIENWVDVVKINDIVEQAAEPLVQRIKDGYIAAGHRKTGALVNSIESFARRRKGNRDPFFTYYVGPRYTSRKGLVSYGGNAAHLLEYGTAERFRADTKKGGAGKKQGLSKVYGATHSTGKVVGTGVIRKAYDQYSPIGISFLKAKILALLIAESKKLSKVA